MKSTSDTPVIIYDGDCQLCNTAVKFLKTESSSGGFRFIPSSDPESNKTLAQYNIQPATTDKTVILIEGNRIYTKSAAIIRAMQRKGRIWKISGILLVIPKFMRDFVYDWIADRRK